jgi:hypothetical protein
MLTAAVIKRTDVTLPKSYQLTFACEYRVDVDSPHHPFETVELAMMRNDVAGAENQYYKRQNFSEVIRIRRDEFKTRTEAALEQML